ncbi:calcium-translocating P-type ATPase, PMCA-type [Anoxybacillus sp. B7M1]|uniref:calcium-translocating P-type ATPase, SERCA-type n=1 Tax=unclassified Anoxybacillus TaxID=2639704 RepID=UPI0005CD71F5|nr:MULTISPECIES: calcium-translocating P-type ATPase, SERCA-type [unclassified Anoxybacillus]ANB58147.1 calcium-translocating P-type ATPase, PMCA-type [Anoxybacillus sp. B2M1]ANB65630.1 calcium-translocating P-type ATPase, PMCA-type [Anoxybacillus sp. B7M1]
MQWHTLAPNDVAKEAHTDLAKGLTTEEAKKRLKRFGYNELKEAKKQSALIVFLNQFRDFMVLVLLAATIISGFLGEYVDAIAIIVIVMMNAFLGFFQERRAEKSLEALKQLSAPQATVLRDGEWMKIHSQELVVGDVIKFTSGDRIGADVRLIDAKGLEIEESALTGESVPTAKLATPLANENTAIGDLHNMAFMGTLVTRGSGVGVVIATGMKTAMGQIANLLQEAETVTTPLQRKLEQLGKILIIVALLLTVLVVVVGVIQGHELYEMFLAGVSLAVAAIPEGLPAIVTIALALGVQRMIKKNAIVRKLPAVETLGCASVICSDKTGTMTENMMTVTNIWASGRMWTVSGTGLELKGEFYENERPINIKKEAVLQQLLTFSTLCNSSQIKEKEHRRYIDGDPTEGALLVAAAKAGLTKAQLESEFTVEQEFPFDSERKMMTVIVKDKSGRRWIITKGAPDVLLEISGHIWWNGRTQPMTADWRKTVHHVIHAMAGKALRTIAVAYRPLTAKEQIPSEKEAEKGLTLMGIQGMIDPPRPEVKKAVQQCKEAGIKTVMITGDHLLTAKAIAKQLGILPPNGKIMDGPTLSRLSVDELEEVVDDIYVFARVSPEHKLKIVKALQRRGHVVAMTGDGVNDAPAIKAADIGVAMGKSGTDVAKEAAALVLLDDNFATIQSAIHEGRNIYENIRKFIRYLLASNVGEILVMLFAMLLALPLPLVPIQILWVNLVTDGLPAMALGLDRAEENVMRRRPRHPKEGVFSRGLGWKIVSRGVIIGIVTLAAFMTVYERSGNNLAYAQTVAFATLVMAQLIHVFDCRCERSIFDRNPLGNMYLVWAVLLSLLLVLVVIYYPPLQRVFHTVSVELLDWILIVGLAALPTFLFAGSFLTRKSRTNML